MALLPEVLGLVVVAAHGLAGLVRVVAVVLVLGMLVARIVDSSPEGLGGRAVGCRRGPCSLGSG